MPREPIIDWPKHNNVSRFVTNLVTDMKLQLAGRKPQERITVERLNRWEEEFAPELEKCTKHVGLKY